MWLRFLVLSARSCLAAWRSPACLASALVVRRSAYPNLPVARGAHRLPAQDPAAHLHRRRRADRRVRRGAARGRRDRATCPQQLKQRDPRGRGRALLPARRRRLPRRAARGLRQPRRRAAGGRARARSPCRSRATSSCPGEDAHAQAPRGAARLQDRAQPHQGPDPRALRQPDLPRPARLRLRRRLADLLRQAARQADARRGGDARRAAEGAVAYNPIATRSAPSSASSTCCAGCASCGYIDASAVRRSDEGAAARAGAKSASTAGARRVRGRNGAPGGRPSTTGGGLHARLPRLHDDPQGRPGSRLRGAARGVLDYDRRHGYRGPEAYVELPADAPSDDDFEDALAEHPGQRRPARRGRARGRRQAGRGGAAHAARRSRSPATGLQVRRARARSDKAAPQQRIRRGAIIRVQRDEQEALADRAAAGGRGRVRRARPAATARSARWSAASTSTATSSTTSRRPGASRARRSSPSSTRRRWRRASRRRP